MTRVLVLGSSGRIGTLLRAVWAQQTAGTGQGAVSFVFQTRVAHGDDLLWDVAQPPPPAVVQAGPFDCMLVLSGIVPRPGADFTRNTAIGSAALRAAAALGIGRVLLASTSAVYGTYSDDPFPEDAPLRPVNDYGRSKREMEAVCGQQAQALGLGLCCLRIGNVAGADALLMNGAALGPQEKLRLDCFSDGGTPLRSYIGPHSLARVLLTLACARGDLPTALNIAAPHPVTMRALAQAARMPLELQPANDGSHQYITLDCSALAQLHRFDPACSEPGEMVRQWRAAASRA